MVTGALSGLVDLSLVSAIFFFIPCLLTTWLWGDRPTSTASRAGVSALFITAFVGCIVIALGSLASAVFFGAGRGG